MSMRSTWHGEAHRVRMMVIVLRDVEGSCYHPKRLEVHDIMQLVMDVALSTYFDAYSSIEEHL